MVTVLPDGEEASRHEYESACPSGSLLWRPSSCTVASGATLNAFGSEQTSALAVFVQHATAVGARKPSSGVPLQSLSRPSQISGEGWTPPVHAPHAPLVHVWVPSRHTPTLLPQVRVSPLRH